MNNENSKVNIDAVIEMNRPELNAFGGASFGSKYFKTEARAAILNFEEAKHNIESNGNIDFIVNRTPLRIKVKDYNIHSICIDNDATGASQLVINKDDEKGEVRIPYGMHNNKPAFSKVTDDALGKAIRGDNSIIFSDAQKLCDQVNAINQAEITRLKKLQEDINKWIQGIQTTIIENNKKKEEYYKQLVRSAEPAEGDAVIVTPANGSMQMNDVVVVNV